MPQGVLREIDGTQSFKGKIETDLKESSELPEASGFLLERIVEAKSPYGCSLYGCASFNVRGTFQKRGSFGQGTSKETGFADGEELSLFNKLFQFSTLPRGQSSRVGIIKEKINPPLLLGGQHRPAGTRNLLPGNSKVEGLV